MKFNTQFTVEENCKDMFTLCGDSLEKIYDLRYTQFGEPYLHDTGKVRDIKDEIQKASVLVADIAELYNRYLEGDDSALNIVVGGQYLDTSVWSKDMIINAQNAYDELIKKYENADSVVTDTETKIEDKKDEVTE